MLILHIPHYDSATVYLCLLFGQRKFVHLICFVMRKCNAYSRILPYGAEPAMFCGADTAADSIWPINRICLFWGNFSTRSRIYSAKVTAIFQTSSFSNGNMYRSIFLPSTSNFYPHKCAFSLQPQTFNLFRIGSRQFGNGSFPTIFFRNVRRGSHFCVGKIKSTYVLQFCCIAVLPFNICNLSTS